MQRAIKLAQEKNPAVQRIAEMLVKSFGEIGEKIRTDLLKAYRGNAKYWFEAFVKASKTQTGRIIPTDYRERKSSDWNEWYRFAEVDSKKKDVYGSFKNETWEDLRAPGVTMKVNYKYADQRANESYENARDSFVHKNLDKIREVLGNRTDVKNSVIKFDWRNGYFKGNLQVYLEGAYFRGDLDIKYVVREIPRVTPYFQYPLIFTDAEIGGKTYARPSEQELRNLLSGKSSEQHEAERQAQAEAEGWCPMSGKEAVGVKIRYGSTAYVKCPKCGAGVTVQHYKYKKHKTKAAEKVAEAKKLTDAGYCPMSGQPAPYHLISKFISPHTVWPGGREEIHYSFSLFDERGKYRKILCEACGQNVVVGRDFDGMKPEEVRVLYQKHKVKK